LGTLVAILFGVGYARTLGVALLASWAGGETNGVAALGILAAFAFPAANEVVAAGSGAALAVATCFAFRTAAPLAAPRRGATASAAAGFTRPAIADALTPLATLAVAAVGAVVFVFVLASNVVASVDRAWVAVIAVIGVLRFAAVVFEVSTKALAGFLTVTGVAVVALAETAERHDSTVVVTAGIVAHAVDVTALFARYVAVVTGADLQAWVRVRGNPFVVRVMASVNVVAVFPRNREFAIGTWALVTVRSQIPVD
jgi:hypothetical protein